jgi:hypothetical protein
MFSFLRFGGVTTVRATTRVSAEPAIPASAVSPSSPAVVIAHHLPAPACLRESATPELYPSLVPETAEGPPIPAPFASALAAVRGATLRPELVLTEIPSPGNLAPWSIALAADVTPARHSSDSELGTGRFILLYDPEEPEAWGGAFRVVCYAQAPLETDIGLDPFLADVAWSWLIDALDTRRARYTAESGTATKILSTGFGELASQGDGAQIELRASWTPHDHDITAHVEGWGELLCMLAGLPPAIEGVSLLAARRVGRE